MRSLAVDFVWDKRPLLSIGKEVKLWECCKKDSTHAGACVSAGHVCPVSMFPTESMRSLRNQAQCGCCNLMHSGESNPNTVKVMVLTADEEANSISVGTTRRFTYDYVFGPTSTQVWASHSTFIATLELLCRSWTATRWVGGLTTMSVYMDRRMCTTDALLTWSTRFSLASMVSQRSHTRRSVCVCVRPVEWAV
jgi:hypothetical protein